MLPSVELRPHKTGSESLQCSFKIFRPGILGILRVVRLAITFFFVHAWRIFPVVHYPFVVFFQSMNFYTFLTSNCFKNMNQIWMLSFSSLALLHFKSSHIFVKKKEKKRIIIAFNFMSTFFIFIFRFIANAVFKF